jgi:hypothetical protein
MYYLELSNIYIDYAHKGQYTVDKSEGLLSLTAVNMRYHRERVLSQTN